MCSKNWRADTPQISGNVWEYCLSQCLNNSSFPKQMLRLVGGPRGHRGAKPAWGGDSQEPARAASEDSLERALPHNAGKLTPWKSSDLSESHEACWPARRLKGVSLRNGCFCTLRLWTIMITKLPDKPPDMAFSWFVDSSVHSFCGD